MKKLIVMLCIVLSGCATSSIQIGDGTGFATAMRPANNLWNCYVSFANTCGPAIAAASNGVQ